MDKVTLRELLESDREAVLAALGRDRSPAAAQAALEKAVDRVLYRYGEACGDARLSLSAQDSLQALRGALPLMGTVSEARQWQREVAPAPKKRLRPAAVAVLALGAGLLAAAMILSGSWKALQSLLPALLGGACLAAGGYLAGKPAREKKTEAPAVRTEFLIDPEAVWSCLQGVMLVADRGLETAASQAALEKETSRADAPDGPIPAEELELFATLLENACARLALPDGEDAREAVSAIRYYLHRRGVEAVDYAPERAAWFEILPARREGTLRPALVADGRLLKKGLASARG